MKSLHYSLPFKAFFISFYYSYTTCLLQAMETRYRSYLEKARSVIKTLDPKHNNNTEVVALRAQITEKDRRIRRLEAEQREKGKSRDQEEKLLVSAWYQLRVDNIGRFKLL